MRTRLPKSTTCAIFFVLGAAISLVLDFFGFTPLANVSGFNSPIQLFNGAVFLVPVIFLICGILIGLFTKKSKISAIIYAACLGQCQTILPPILFYFVFNAQLGTFFEVVLRSFCGIVMTVPSAAMVFEMKVFQEFKKNRKR